MVPSQTSIMLSLFEGQKIQDSRITFWEDVYGFKMEAMREEIYDEAVIDVVDEKEVASGFVSLSVRARWPSSSPTQSLNES